MLVPLQCPAQNYAWGKPGLESTVAQLAKAAGAEVDESKPYAELWVGTHPNGPAKIEEQTLAEYLKEHPETVSADKAQQEECAKNGLPYLFKILSVNKALSIQAHPDKKLAEQLHADRPSVYKDPNHKPEMACAVTDFEALCGFLPLSETVGNIRETPELQELLEASEEAKALLSDEAKLGSVEEDQQKASLKILFSSLMNSDADLVAKQTEALKKRLEGESDLQMPNKLALRLVNDYPGDVGVFCAYILCYRVLAPGQAVFLGANEPHAYLLGDCAEIMACSDNVVRAGLTPKLRDTPTLCSMLTYRQPSHEGAEFHPGNMLEGRKSGEHSEIYAPPDPAVTEFQMERVVLKPADGSYSLEPSSYGSVVLVLEGEGSAKGGATSASDAESDAATKKAKHETDLKRGDIFFQPCGSSLSVEAKSDLIVFRATLKGAF
ncbi:Mannose-6-phosphate isomerase [Hondaea fermentalgiana]|uniref:mannose-6-phosphate isomerase n=1 Tax=Hondaea fermentalgiana TaxID=2315210 RepID=A0A2R5GPC1_9STRA|nr:Mannose-6-phosphate isomerase [Hondaea fermentalgiana]|eukprot:GBG32720.1 Mannose-6-phosphate isomerase [Hondaea fermentalgiana]